MPHDLTHPTPTFAPTEWLVDHHHHPALFVGVSSPQQLPVSLYKLSLVSLAAVVGYWLDRSLFPYARPDRFMGECYDLAIAGHLAAVSMIRRAVIVGCAMLAMGLGA